MLLKTYPIDFDTIVHEYPTIAECTTEDGIICCQLYDPEVYADGRRYCSGILGYTPIDGAVSFGYRRLEKNVPLELLKPITERFVNTTRFEHFLEYLIRTYQLCMSTYEGIYSSDLEDTKSLDKYMQKFFDNAKLYDRRMLPWYFTYIKTWTEITGVYPEEIVAKILSYPINENVVNNACKKHEYHSRTYLTQHSQEIIMNHYNTNWLKVAIKESHKALVELHEKHVTTPIVTNPENIDKFSKVHFQVPIPNYSR